MSLTTTQQQQLNWLVQFYIVNNQTFWMGIEYDSVDECLEAIDVYYADHPNEIQDDYMSYQC